MTALRDIWLIAGFEIRRAIRSWRALALLVLYGVASGGATLLFTRFVGMLENTLADELNVAPTETPGTMLAQLVTSELWHRTVRHLVGSDHLADVLVTAPPLAVFGLWFGFLVVPFFAASASAECVAIDVSTRAIRYEAQRTGRLELVLGRFVGQLGLNAVATLAASAVVWVVAMTCMYGVQPVDLAVWLLAFAPRAWTFGLPFTALGTAASQLTASSAWARVLALGGTAGSWVVFGLVTSARREPWTTVADVVGPVLPQSWLQGLWEPGFGWLVSAAACAGLAAVALSVGYVRFSARDL